MNRRACCGGSFVAVALAALLALDAHAQSGGARGLSGRAPGASPWDFVGDVEVAFIARPARAQLQDPRRGTYRGRVQVVLLGDRERGSEVALEWDARRPPVLQPIDAGEAWSSDVLVLLDSAGRPLFLGERDPLRTASALGTARRSSSAFSERELRWAWYATESHYARGALAKRATASARGDVTLRALELRLRCDDPERKVQLLDSLAAEPRLPADVLEVARTSLWDLVPEVQAAAVHLLLDHDFAIDAEGLASLRAGPRADGLELLGALARLREPRALEQLAAMLLEHAPPARTSSQHLARMLEQAVHGDASFQPLLRPYVDAGVEAAFLPWLATGGVADAVDERVRFWSYGKRNYRLPREDYGPAMASFLARRDARGVLANDSVTRIRRMVAEARAGSAELCGVLIAELRAALPELEEPAQRAWLLAELLRLGDAQVLEEMERRSRDGSLDILQRLGWIAPLADHASPAAVELLVDGLVETLAAPWHDDCTGEEGRTIAAYTTALARIPEPERREAHELFERRLSTVELHDHRWIDGLDRPGYERGYLVGIRWLLGELPTASEIAIADLGWYWDEFSLAGHEAEYRDALPELRADPCVSWRALGLLQDETSVPALGALLSSADYSCRIHALEALRRIGSPGALPDLYAATDDEHTGWVAEVYEAIGELEHPHALSRLAAACAGGSDAEAPARRALLIALTRE